MINEWCLGSQIGVLKRPKVPPSSTRVLTATSNLKNVKQLFLETKVADLLCCRCAADGCCLAHLSAGQQEPLLPAATSPICSHALAFPRAELRSESNALL